MNLSTELKNFDGTAIREGDDKVTLGAVILRALVAPLTGDEKMTANDKLKIALLARDVHAKADGEIDFTSEQVTLIKDRVAKAYAPVVMLTIWELIDPASVKA